MKTSKKITNRLLSFALAGALMLMGMGCEEEVNQNFESADCGKLDIKSTHTNIKARIYDRSHRESTSADYMLVYSKEFVETGTFISYDSIISPCNQLPADFQQDGILVSISFELLDRCNLFTFEHVWGDSYGCLANILEIKHLENEN